MKRCSGCRKVIRSSQRFIQVSEGVPMEDGSGWLMKPLRKYHAGQCAKSAYPVFLGYSYGTKRRRSKR